MIEGGTLMPSMYLNVPKLETAKRDQLVEKLYEAATTVLRVPHIYTFVNEYETVYENGKPWDAPNMNVVNLEAGPMPVEKIEVIAGHMTEAVQAVLGEDQGTTLVYHANALDHIAINGKLIKK
jgi:phenylpyruvate tautomerase PptA (4-oxalocrotonate tautomerase family)